MPRAYSYLRFSHDSQSAGDSVRRQHALRDGWLRRHGVPLDTGLTLEDRGTSAFAGAHRGNPDRHALAAFLSLVEAGQVERGSFLLVENLDRLSREHIQPALLLVLGLLQAGIRIVQLSPAEMVFDDKSDSLAVMMMIMELSRGHGESVMKSERVGAAWKLKKASASTSPLTARGPAWLRLEDGRWRIVESAAETVRYVYRLATDGHSVLDIARRLNRESVPTIARSAHWGVGVLTRMLRSRAVFGEYQPKRASGTIADGPAVVGYYPTILSEDEFYAARASIVSRTRQKGRHSSDGVNIFAGLLHDAANGGAIHISGKRLLSVAVRQGRATVPICPFPRAVFQARILDELQEVSIRDVTPKQESGTTSLVGRLAELDAEIERVKARVATRFSDALADVLDRHAAERTALVERLDEMRLSEAQPLRDAWRRCKSLASLTDTDSLLRLRAAIRRVCVGIWCVFVRNGPSRVGIVQLHFTGGAHRTYLLDVSASSSFREDKLTGVDLRKRGDAVKAFRLLRDG